MIRRKLMSEKNMIENTETKQRIFRKLNYDEIDTRPNFLDVK